MVLNNRVDFRGEERVWSNLEEVELMLDFLERELYSGEVLCGFFRVYLYIYGIISFKIVVIGKVVLVIVDCRVWTYGWCFYFGFLFLSFLI